MAEINNVIAEASQDLQTIEDFVNLSADSEVYPRLLPSVNVGTLAGARQAIFEAGGLPAKPFATKALMTASALVDGDYAMVTDDTNENNGLYIKDLGVWTKSTYDVEGSVLAEVNKRLESDAVEALAHAFVDSNNKILASISADGKFDLDATDATKESINYIKKDSNTEQTVVIIDKNNKILMTIPPLGEQQYGSSSGEQMLYPSRTAQPEVFISSMVELTNKMQVNTTAKGRTTDPDIIVRGDGFTHPKMIYIPGGWNGYAYWLTATPVFGVIPSNGDAYENPHVFASNDLMNWVEPTGAPLDLPEDGNLSYWSDTHLEIGDDGYMYCWYRGNGFSFQDRFVVYRRTRDGVNWSDRVVVNKNGGALSSANLLLSPAIHRDGTKWVVYDLLRSDSRGLVFPVKESSTKTHVFRRTINNPSDEFGAYNESQIVNYSPRLWGADTDPWHIDSIKVGNMYFHLLAVGDVDFHMSKKLYLAWSTDGWNFTVLPRLETGAVDDYRSSITATKVGGGLVELKLVNAKLDGTMKLHNLIIGVK